MRFAISVLNRLSFPFITSHINFRFHFEFCFSFDDYVCNMLFK